MTRRSNSKKFKVFDFDDDDRSENLQTRFSGDLRKMRKKNKKRDDSPINKYHFLQSCIVLFLLSIFGCSVWSCLFLEKMRAREK
ncbi:hypothetical protein L484_011375 [Morus notabilis]|uniref:Transmembrane protein n=1 Tax=Morus notabilis TaxID=981085 RepID=W9RJS0_9ROSA|nr:hypothetical protein L484_011375 [Morus notabilis]